MLPPLVQRALELERAQGFDRSCAPELGRLLHVLAAERARTRMAGSGAAVGAAWIVSALAPQVPFFAAEPDEARAAAAAELFRDDENVHVLGGDWRATLPREAPFDLLFLAAASDARPREDAELAIGLLAPGGLAVLDDPSEPASDVWLAHPALAAVRLETSEADAAILAVRR